MVAREVPAVGQESVWDYPRPPALEASPRRVVVQLDGHLLADSIAAYRVLETSHPPTWYLPRADVVPDVLRPSRTRSTWCEWKGAATYWDVVSDQQVVEGAAWSYERPDPRYSALTGYLTFYPARFDCFVDDERVRPQEGGFYGGWITSDVVGPFKGGPGTWGW